MSRKKRVKLSIQKLFCFVSFIFLSVCVLWYGGRTIYFYLDSKKKPENNNLLIQYILKNNRKTKTFKKVNNEYYFYKNPDNNYITFSNLTWRIIKITKDNKILLILDTPITSLAYGNYKDNFPLQWLNLNSNEKNTGILENNIKNIDKYLTKTTSCISNIDNLKNIKCKETNNDNYFSLLDLEDYIITGAKDSFINNGYYNYLINKNKEEIWYINSEGELSTNNGEEIYGIKPVITLKENINYKKGNGTKDSPYIIEDENQLFASYVKLDNDIYRVYNIDDDILKLSLNNYLEINSEKIEHSYSNNNYYHNDTKYNTLAYYLNKNYYTKLNYKELILTNYYSNYYYGEDNNYNYKEVLNKKVDTKIYTLSIGDPILNNLNNYFIASGTNESNSLIYIKEIDGTVTKETVTTEKNIIPCISINKNKLIKGTGTESDPYRTE